MHKILKVILQMLVVLAIAAAIAHYFPSFMF